MNKHNCDIDFEKHTKFLHVKLLHKLSSKTNMGERTSPKYLVRYQITNGVAGTGINFTRGAVARWLQTALRFGTLAMLSLLSGVYPMP